MRKRTIYILAVTIVAAILVGISLARGRNQATEATIEAVQKRDLVASVTASGQVLPHTKVDVSSDITGRITRLAVKEGDLVQKGQFLLEIDPSEYRAAVERSAAAAAASRAQAAQAHANLLQAQHTYDRTAELKRRNPDLVADEQLEQLLTAVTVDKALLTSSTHSISEAEASLRDAQSSLAKTTIVAPLSGRVTRLNVEQGETAIMGTLNKDAATLLTISDMGDLETKVKVDETDVSRIKVGDSAVVQLDAFPDTTFRGLVTEISNSSTQNGAMSTGSAEQAVEYRVTVHLLDAPRSTRPDFSATAKIITATRRQVLAIPIIALTVRDNIPIIDNDSAVTFGKAPAKSVGVKDVEGVFVVNRDGRVTFRPVRVGVAGEKYFEVLSGLQQGERIVSGTYQTIRTLKDSMKVQQSRTTSGDSTVR